MITKLADRTTVPVSRGIDDPRMSRRHDDLALHLRMQSAKIVVGARHCEGERKAFVRIECLRMERAVCPNDRMGNVVAIAEYDRGSSLHGELLWREWEIIDVHFGLRRANGQGRNGGETSGDNQRTANAPSAGVEPCAQSQHVRFP